MKRNSILFCLLFFIAADLFTPAKAQVNVNDSLALVDFYNNTGGPNWDNHANWLTTNPVSTWYGVTVTDTRVTSLNLFNNSVGYSIPSSISNFTKLDTLDLSYNFLSGTIPSFIGNLVNLTYLNLQLNYLNGTIPDGIGNLANLKMLDLSDNYLSGAIPASIGKLAKLTSLNLAYDGLSGAIPAEIGNLVNLTELALEANQLNGNIPTSISNLVNLTTLIVGSNQLSGTIPSSISKLTSLTHLDLNNNQFTGFPSSIGNLANLTYLDVRFNELRGNIPAEIGKLLNLTFLNLSVNHLSGAIPPSLGNLLNLTGLNLSSNQLSGAIPSSFKKFLHHLKGINLSYNHLTQDNNVFFSKGDKHLTMLVQDNRFTFNGLEYVATKLPNSYYYEQANIPIHQQGNILSVYAGGTLSNNTYKWHQVGETNVTTITGDSTFSPIHSGKYYVDVTNAVATGLTLYSNTIDFTLSPLKQSNNTLIAKGVQPTMVVKHMQVFPNPAKEMVHVQVKGTAMIAITNTAGKVLLTKSINNSDAIDVSSLAPGIYYLQNKTSGEVQKIIIIH